MSFFGKVKQTYNKASLEAENRKKTREVKNKLDRISRLEKLKEQSILLKEENKVMLDFQKVKLKQHKINQMKQRIRSEKMSGFGSKLDNMFGANSGSVPKQVQGSKKRRVIPKKNNPFDIDINI